MKNAGLEATGNQSVAAFDTTPVKNALAAWIASNPSATTESHNFAQALSNDLDNVVTNADAPVTDFASFITALQESYWYSDDAEPQMLDSDYFGMHTEEMASIIDTINGVGNPKGNLVPSGNHVDRVLLQFGSFVLDPNAPDYTYVNDFCNKITAAVAEEGEFMDNYDNNKVPQGGSNLDLYKRFAAGTDLLFIWDDYYGVFLQDTVNRLNEFFSLAPRPPLK